MRDALGSFRLLVFIAEALKHKQPDRRGQVALFTRQVDLGNQFRQRHLPSMRDFLQVKASSRLTLVLCPSITMERLMTEDFIRAPVNPYPALSYSGF